MNEPVPGIAIVGLAARFPGAPDAQAFWRNLRDGVEAISFLSGEELSAAGVDPRELADPHYVPAKGVLDGADRFDAAFFGLTPREAEVMDPQHRVFLECAWEALEDAGCDPRRYGTLGTAGGRIGVWAGSGASTYLLSNLLPGGPERLASFGGLQVLLLNDRDFLATRTSFAFDLKGPSAAVQTACSTSLVAVHLAVQSLLGGECQLALAGGVSVSVPLRAGYLFQEGSVASPDGHCRAFDAAAAGAVEGNGCGVVVLKRLADALEDGDRVYAVIRGSAVNNDGAGKVGFTAPSVAGQADVISEALLVAGVEPRTIGYVEAHGSGTPLGDPIEMAALAEAFRSAAEEGEGELPAASCAVSSVKTAIGHCNTAAGVAGLIKATLALVHRTLPPSLHFTTANPEIDFAGGPFYVPTQAAPWETADGAPRRAGVSSFGIGGTNAHLVLEEAPAVEPGEAPSRPAQLLVLSARSAAALAAAAARLADHLEAQPELDGVGLAGIADIADIADIAWTLQTGRKAFEHRRIAVARDRQGAIESLRAPAGAAGSPSGRREEAAAPPVVFLFPGLGDQFVDMARELYDAEPAFRAEVDRCAEALAPTLGADLRQVMFAAAPRAARPAEPAASPASAIATDLRALLRRDGSSQSADDPAEARLRRTLYAHPACFVVEYALGKLLLSWGIVPQALLGYSLGEYVAACLAGSLTLDQALTLVAERAKRIEALPEGAMLAIPLAEAEVRPLLEAAVSLAATNGPHLSVAAGPVEAVDELARRLAGRGVTCLRLRTTHAFHSALMEPAVAGFADFTRTVAPRMQPPRLPWLSNVTGSWITAGDLADPSYWARHMTSTVRFAEALGELLADPERLFLEVGPGSTLGTLVQQHPAATVHRLTLSTLPRAEERSSDLTHLLAAVGRLWIAGVDVDWAAFHGGERRRKVALPTYPFERQRYWIDPPAFSPSAVPSSGATALAGAVGPAATLADLADWFWVPSWERVPLAGPAPDAPPESWLLFLDAAGETGVGERIAARLRGQGHTVTTVVPGIAFQEVGEGAFAIVPGRREDYDALFKQLRRAGAPLPGRMLHLWGMTAAEPAFEAAQGAGLVSLVLLVQAIAAAGGSTPIRLGLVANGLSEVLEGDPVHAGKATVLGALKVVHQELPRLAVGAIDAGWPVDGSTAGQAGERLAGQLVAELSGPAEPAVALRGRHRFVRRFAPVRLAGDGTALSADGVYLIVGAGEGPGPALAEHLARRVGARIAAVLPPDGSSDRLLALEKEIGPDRLLILRAEPAGLGAAWAETRARFGPIAGAFCTTGTFTGGLLQLKDPEALGAALAPVARSAEALLAAATGPDSPGFVVLLATTAAATGGLGEIELAAAGSYLEALAARPTSVGDERVRAVLWDPYQWDGWLVAGAAAGGPLAVGSAEEVQAGLLAHAVAAERSGAALARLLAHPLPGAPAVVISSRDLPGLVAETDSLTADTLFATAAPGQPKAGRPALRTPYEAPRDEVEERLAELWQDLFGIAPIGRDDSFLELGGHSLLAIQIVTQVKGLFGADLPVTALFEAPTVAELAQAVRRARGEVDPAQLEALLALVEELSPDEAAARLAEMGL